MARCPHPLWHITWAALLVACHEGPSGTAQTSVRDSAGVEIIHLPAVPDDTEAVLVDPEPALVVGGADGSEDDLFHEVIGVHSEGGRILVSQPTELRVYSPTVSSFPDTVAGEMARASFAASRPLGSVGTTPWWLRTSGVRR